MPKIRCISLFQSLRNGDLYDTGTLSHKIAESRQQLDMLRLAFIQEGWEVQTVRLVFNSFENWLLPKDYYLGEGQTCKDDEYNWATIEEVLELGMGNLIYELEKHDIDFCSVGPATTVASVRFIPAIIGCSTRLSTSVQQLNSHVGAPHVDMSLCKAAAQAVKTVAANEGVLGNFRFCIGFNCPYGIPFFPAAFATDSPPGEARTEYRKNISIGLECGDILFLAFHGVRNLADGTANLSTTLHQLIAPLEVIAKETCKKLGIGFYGFDCSLNPGLSIPDSVGGGLEWLLNTIPPPLSIKSKEGNHGQRQFGSFGTLACVSSITSAVKSLQNAGDVTLVGYNGLMLPVMEDFMLSERAAQVPPTFGLRDLLTFSSVCGVGLDTVPIPGDVCIEDLVAIYLETGALAFRLNKPLSCRLLPIPGKIGGEFTDVFSPYLCNTRVFHV